MLILVLLAVAAFVAGVTGTWSPCGLSMVETIGGPHSGRGRVVVATSCVTFAVGAVIGGLVTFVVLSLLGGVLSSEGGPVALGVAALIAALAAAAEFSGLRIVPQIPRQVPEPWRRVMPLPVAGVLYGVLLGLGFTTFVLTMAVWALAAISVALGSVAVGVAIGLGFGLGRALPIMVLAPRVDDLGHRVLSSMAERPSLLRSARACNGLLLVALAGAFAITAGTGQAVGAKLIVDGGFDPSASGASVAWSLPDGQVVSMGPGERVQSDGDAIAIGAGLRAVASDGVVRVWRGATAASEDVPPMASRHIQATSGLAVSAGWLAWRRPRPGGGDLIYASALPDLRKARLVARTRPNAQLSRPGLYGHRLVFAQTSPAGSRIVAVDLRRGKRSTLRRSRTRQLHSPALHGSRLLYVEAGYCAQRLVVGPSRPGARGRIRLMIGTSARRDPGYEPGHTSQGSEAARCPRNAPTSTWTVLGGTALTSTHAFVEMWKPAAVRADSRIMRMPAR